MFGYGLVIQEGILRKVFTGSCTPTCLQYNPANGFGGVNAPWRSRCLAGFCSLTDFTPRICWLGDSTARIRMTIFASSAVSWRMRIGYIYFLTAPSAVESGTIWVLIGLEVQIFCNVSCTPGLTSHTLSSLKSYSQQPGIFGSGEMAEFSELRELLSVLGSVISSMTFPCLLTGWRIVTGRNFWLGLILCCKVGRVM